MFNWLINRAKRTPYFHLAGYMERYWLVPYSAVITCPEGQTDGTGPVSGFRPIARLLQAFDIAVRVHHILRSDLGRDPHDHPWPYLTVILKGGYNELRYDADGKLHSAKWHGPGSILWRPAKSLHKLVVREGETAWTLFITGRKEQTWGFKPQGQPKIPYTKYTGEA